MLAVTSTNGLSVLDHAILKKAPSSFPSCLSLLEPPTASAWSTDNASLFLASSQSIHKYDPVSNSLTDVFSSESISHLVAKEKTTVIFSAENDIHVLECGSVVKISQTFSSHKATVCSLSLSNDATLLASTSSGAAHVHNLTHGSHTVLRGLPLSGPQSITTSAFHPHSRTRLLLGIGKQLVVYDTTRPSGPIKTVSLNESSSGDIFAIACSPFSKTLVAVATSGGTLGLVDLDKEKGLFRTINVKVPLSSISFSHEGASIYLGTENGKLLILDLRALDKPPKSIVISENGYRIVSLSVQKKIKGSSDAASSKKETITAARKPSSTIASVSKPSPAKLSRAVSGTSKFGEVRKADSKDAKDDKGIKKVFSPVRSPLGKNGGNLSPSRDDFSIQIDTLSALRGPAQKTTPIKDAAERRRERISTLTSPSSKAREAAAAGQSTSISGRLRATHPSSQSPISASQKARKEDISPVIPRRTRTLSTASTPLSASKNSKKGEEAGSTAHAVSRRTRTVSTTSNVTSLRSRKVSTTESTDAGGTANRLAAGTKEGKNIKTMSSLSPNYARTRTVSTASRAGSSVSAAIRGPKSSNGSSRPGSSASRAGAAVTQAGISVPPVPPLPRGLGGTKEVVGRKSSSNRGSASRTPSPDLSDVAPMSPVTPLPVKRKGMQVLGLGTPGLRKWDDGDGDDDEDGLLDRKGEGEGEGEGNEKGKGKARGKVVGFRDESRSGSSEGDDNETDDDELEGGAVGDDQDQDREESLSIQISPRRSNPIRPSSTTSASASLHWASKAAASASPIRAPHLNAHHPIPGSPNNGTSPQDFLRTIVRDVMYDFQMENRNEMMGLHLDLVRMGRSWKKELRELMDEYVGDLRELREENRKLKDENERLRRGY